MTIGSKIRQINLLAALVASLTCISVAYSQKPPKKVNDHATHSTLKQLDALHCVLRFITGDTYRTYHCVLHKKQQSGPNYQQEESHT